MPLGGLFCFAWWCFLSPPLASYPLPLQHDVKHMIRTVAYVNIWYLSAGPLQGILLFVLKKMPPIMCPATSLLPCNQIKLLRLWLVGPERNGRTQVNQKNWGKQPSGGALSWRGDVNLCHDCWGEKRHRLQHLELYTPGMTYCSTVSPVICSNNLRGYQMFVSGQVYTKAGQGNILCRGTIVTHQGFPKLLWCLQCYPSHETSPWIYFLSPSVKTSQEILMTAACTKKF